MPIKKIKPKSPDPYLGKTKGDNTLARIAHVNQLVDQINLASTYKVYTALLTQSGTGYDPNDQDEGQLTIGKTYYINNLSVGMDFTNVGASNNNVGTYFVATGSIPNSWGANEGSGGIATLIYDNSAPVVKVLENTIGNIWFTYNNDGEYSVNSNALFTTDKTFIVIVAGSIGRPDVLVTYITNTDSNIRLNSVRAVTPSSPLNDLLLNTSIEIRVYN